MSGGLPNTTPGPMVHAVNSYVCSVLEIGRAWLCLSQTRYHPPDAREGRAMPVFNCKAEITTSSFPVAHLDSNLTDYPMS